jgi:hypothetical protein
MEGRITSSRNRVEFATSPDFDAASETFGVRLEPPSPGGRPPAG